jgi:hypothetical protein
MDVESGSSEILCLDDPNPCKLPRSNKLPPPRLIVPMRNLYSGLSIVARFFILVCNISGKSGRLSLDSSPQGRRCECDALVIHSAATQLGTP